MIFWTPKFRIKYSSSFKKDLKSIIHNVKLLWEIEEVITYLSFGELLDDKYRDHALKWKFSSCRECHIRPDVLLIYETKEDVLELYLLRLGSHSELFG
jgi:mRNA interferase YafQ